MKSFMRLTVALIIVLSLCSCKTMSGDPAKNMVYYGPNNIMNINKDFQYIGRTGAGYTTDDAGGSFSKGRQSVQSHNFVKANSKNNVEEFLSVRKKTPKLGWYFLPPKSVQVSYFDYLMPNYNKEEKVIYEMAKNNGYNFSGRYKAIRFNDKWSDQVLRDTIYSIHTSLIPKDLNESEIKDHIKQKALEAIGDESVTSTAKKRQKKNTANEFIEIDKRDIVSSDIRIFESPYFEADNALNREYSEIFFAKDVQHIFYELNANIVNDDQSRIELNLTDVWYKDGELVTSNTHKHYFSSPFDVVHVWKTAGTYKAEAWPKGNYKVSIFDRHNNQIGSASFTIK